MNTIVIEKTQNGDVAIDVYQKLADDRIIFLSEFIDDKVSSEINATLLLKDLESPSEKITMFINSEGGDIRSVFSIYDMMNSLSAPIETVCIGSAMHEAALLLAAGTKGMRLATKNSLISLGQLVNDHMNMVDLTDAKKTLDQSIYDNKKMIEAFAKCTGKTVKEISSDFDRTMFLNASQSLKYGLIDKVIAGNKK